MMKVLLIPLLVLASALVGCSAEEPPVPETGIVEPVIPNVPVGTADCCSCAVQAGGTVSDPRLPCTFDYPAGWEVHTGDDGALVSSAVGPRPESCGTVCPAGAPAMSVSYGKKPDSNADAMLEIWQMGMPVVGKGRCGAGTVQFFSPPGAEATGPIGGVKFYVQIGDVKYGGAATFTCGVPGGWMNLRDMFINSFRDNPGSTFPGG